MKSDMMMYMPKSVSTTKYRMEPTLWSVDAYVSAATARTHRGRGGDGEGSDSRRRTAALTLHDERPVVGGEDLEHRQEGPAEVVCTTAQQSAQHRDHTQHIVTDTCGRVHACVYAEV
jgi:hypothetical protein